MQKIHIIQFLIKTVIEDIYINDINFLKQTLNKIQ